MCCSNDYRLSSHLIIIAWPIKIIKKLNQKKSKEDNEEDMVHGKCGMHLSRV